MLINEKDFPSRTVQQLVIPQMQENHSAKMFSSRRKGIVAVALVRSSSEGNDQHLIV